VIMTSPWLLPKPACKAWDFNSHETNSPLHWGFQAK
jgi:hypothetical protein